MKISAFGKPREQRSRVGPMDIDTADVDSSWLQSPSDERSRKRRFVGSQPGAGEPESARRPVLGNTPFVFSMPVQQPAPEPMDWEVPRAAFRSDNMPISPHAARKIAARRRHDTTSHETDRHDTARHGTDRHGTARHDTGRRDASSDTPGFALIQNSPMVGDQRFNRRRQRRQRQNQQRRLNQQQQQQQRAADEASSAWTTASSESEDEDGDSDSDRDRASNHGASAATPSGAGSNVRSGRARRSARSRREWRMSHGVDRVLAMMGNRVEAPSTTERLQMHRDIPYVISGYLQLAFNVFMVGTVLVLVLHVLLTIQRDVNAKVHEYSADILHEIATCSKQYLDNRCDPLMRVPAMEQACAAWEACMHRDPTKVSRARVSAETLAEIVNGFIEPISLKTMLFFVCMFFGTLFISNFAFGAYRHSRVSQQYVSQSGDARPVFGSSERSILASALRARRNDDPMASPSPHAAAAAQMLVSSSASGLSRRRHRPHSPSTSLTRRDRSAHSSDRTHNR
ncbi:hypothetical protein IWW50_004871 [Coemansia erecta]|nr:hypothetical protein IWW50_004871 [Coemansia erecta]